MTDLCQQLAFIMQIAILVSDLRIFTRFQCCLSCLTLLMCFDMASIGPGNNVVVVLHVGGSKAYYIKLTLWSEHHIGKTLFHAGSILPSEAHVDAAVRELFEEIGLTLTVEDLMLSSGNHVRLPLSAGRCQLVHVFSASGHVPYVLANLRTPTKVERVVTAQSFFHHDGPYVAPTTIDIDELSLTPSKIGVVAFWLHSSVGILSRCCNFSTTLPSPRLVATKATIFAPLFTVANCVFV
jgi:8-oxo-dGTP pyrophosphatase MutT (NUDIX family)